MKDILDSALNTPTGVITTVSVSTFNIAGASIPDIINYGTLIYLLLLITHKGWKMYKEWKTGKHEPE